MEFARGYAMGLVTEAKAALEKVLAPSDARKLLLSMADFFVKRVS
jgi:geranylgeranyl pyrophosphate synthase